MLGNSTNDRLHTRPTSLNDSPRQDRFRGGEGGVYRPQRYRRGPEGPRRGLGGARRGPGGAEGSRRGPGGAPRFLGTSKSDFAADFSSMLRHIYRTIPLIIAPRRFGFGFGSRSGVLHCLLGAELLASTARRTNLDQPHLAKPIVYHGVQFCSGPKWI